MHPLDGVSKNRNKISTYMSKVNKEKMRKNIKRKKGKTKRGKKEKQ